MENELKRTPWNRLAVRFHVPETTGVFLLGDGAGAGPQDVLCVGSAPNLRARLLELLGTEDLKVARVVHWVAGLSIEQARLAERIFARRFDPPHANGPRSRYMDILVG